MSLWDDIKKNLDDVKKSWKETNDNYMENTFHPKMTELQEKNKSGRVLGMLDNFVDNLANGKVEAGMYQLFFEMLFSPINIVDFQIKAAKLRRKLNQEKKEKADADLLKLKGMTETEATQQIYNIFLKHGNKSAKIADEIKKKNPEMMFKDFEKFKKNNPDEARKLETLKKEDPAAVSDYVNGLMASNPKDFLDIKNNKDMSTLQDRILQSEFKKVYNRDMTGQDLKNAQSMVGKILKNFPNGRPDLQEQNNPQPQPPSRNDDRDDATRDAYVSADANDTGISVAADGNPENNDFTVNADKAKNQTFSLSDSTLLSQEEQKVVQTAQNTDKPPLAPVQNMDVSNPKQETPTEPTRKADTLIQVASAQLPEEQMHNLSFSVKDFKQEAAALNQQKDDVAKNRQMLNMLFMSTENKANANANVNISVRDNAGNTM